MNRRFVAVSAVVLMLVGIAAAARASRPPVAAGYVRIDQVGFAPWAPKVAFLMTSRAVPGAAFEVVRGRRVLLRGHAGRDQGAWSARFPHVYALDLSRLHASGSFRVLVPRVNARSPLFRVAAPTALYAGPLANAVRFFRAQRDGSAAAGGPLRRQASHLLDAQASVYAQPSAAQLRSGRFTSTGRQANVEGGWFDAGDYLKFVETTSFTDVLMLWAARDHPGSPPRLAAEARTGIDWLERMYDPGGRTLLYQVGMGDGHGAALLGDHDLWRLPQRDDHLRGKPSYYVMHRPAFQAGPAGTPLSPNLAGRMAAAFALCAQVYRASDPGYAARCLDYGEAAFAQARTTAVTTLLTSAPHRYYPEASWRDDLAVGATELYLALRDAGQGGPAAVRYLDAAGKWANAYAAGPGADADSLNLYDVEALTDFDLARALRNPPSETDVPTDPASLANDLRDQLRLGVRSAARHPFGLANPNTWTDSVAHALGYSISAQLYDRLRHTGAYAAFGQHQLDWALGANAWGSSFVVGDGTTFPHCLQHQVANLAGSLSGHGALLLGAAVAGPTAAAEVRNAGAPDGYRRCSVRSFARYDGHGAVYRDDVRSAATSEPSDDISALALLALSQRL